MHRGVNGWISDEDTRECWDDKKDILNYCKSMYPNHNVTNVVEAAYLVTIPGWPSLRPNTVHTHRVRPFRCIVGAFQSDALLVPQHCKFDHKHNDEVCKGFSHWEVIARDACGKDGMHCESFGMLLNCGLGTFSGVEYVCCPDQTPTHVHPTPPPADEDSSEDLDETDQDSDDDEEDDDDDWESSEEDDDDEEEEDANVNLYEKYLKGERLPSRFSNEHQKFVAARQFMHKLQEAKNTQLMKEWTAARDHVNEVRKNDPKTADKLNKEITERFQRLYNAYEQEDIAEKQQIVALHQQHRQAELNVRKRETMDKYMRALEKGDVLHVAKFLRQYIRVEEKDTMRTINHYSHVKQTNPAEATRIHPHVIQHLQLCQQRMEQALDMLKRYPDIERKVRPDIEDFMKTYDDLATRIRNVVLPEPTTSNIQTDSDSSEDFSPNNAGVQPQMIDQIGDDISTESEDLEEDDDDLDENMENEHDFQDNPEFIAHHQQDSMAAEQSLNSPESSASQLGPTFAIAIGSVAIFVVLVVAVVMLRRRGNARTNVTHGYVEVDPAASPEERHVANMQMNGYENPTYRYFEVQSQQ
nr:hypothetical protein BaRGS_007927 [Batillaria attramentaria]